MPKLKIKISDGRFQALAGALLLLAVLFVDSLGLTNALIIGPYLKHIIFAGLIYSILTLSLNILQGYVGVCSLGHAAFFGLGAYISAICMTMFHLPFWPAFAIAGLLTALFGIPLGLPGIRVSGGFLTVITYGFGEVMRFTVFNMDRIGGPSGIPGIPTPTLGKNFASFGPTGKEAFIIMALLIALLVAFIMARIEKSPLDLVFAAVKEDEVAAGTMGISPPYYKLLAFVIAALFAGLAGSLYASYTTYVSPEIFSINESVIIISMVVIGGVRSIRGSFVGAFTLTLLPEFLKWGKDALGLPFDPWMCLYGLALIIFMRVRPQGILGHAPSVRH